jgi:hypothetical protein
MHAMNKHSRLFNQDINNEEKSYSNIVTMIMLAGHLIYERGVLIFDKFNEILSKIVKDCFVVIC